MAGGRRGRTNNRALTGIRAAWRSVKVYSLGAYSVGVLRHGQEQLCEQFVVKQTGLDGMYEREHAAGHFQSDFWRGNK